MHSLPLVSSDIVDGYSSTVEECSFLVVASTLTYIYIYRVQPAVTMIDLYNVKNGAEWNFLFGLGRAMVSD